MSVCLCPRVCMCVCMRLYKRVRMELFNWEFNFVSHGNSLRLKDAVIVNRKMCYALVVIMHMCEVSGFTVVKRLIFIDIHLGQLIQRNE